MTDIAAILGNESNWLLKHIPKRFNCDHSQLMQLTLRRLIKNKT